MKKYTKFYIFLILIIIISSKIQLNFTIKEDGFSEENEKNNSQKGKLKSFIEAPMGSDPDSKTTMKVCLGYPNQCFDLVIQTNSFYIMVSDADSKYKNPQVNYFNKTKSMTKNVHSRILELDYYDQKIIGQKITDRLTINGQRISKINFLLANSLGKFRDIDGFIGLGYNPNKEEKKFSLIQQLFEKGKIAHKVFTQYYYDNYNGVITLGEIPEYIVNDYIHYGRCKALNKIRNGKEYKNNNWECYIDFMYYGNNVNDMFNMAQFIEDNYKQEVLFLSYRKRSFLPSYLFDMVGQTYLRQALYDKKCTSYYGGIYKWYECDMNLKLPNLNLVFNAWEIRISSDKLFTPSKHNKNKKEFIFYNKHKFEKFLIGRSLLKEFEMVYDYANKQIGFYHKSVRYIGNEKIGPPKVYHFLKDDDEYKTKRINKSETLLPDATPDEVNNNYDPFVQRCKVYLADIFKKVFEILIIIVGIILVLFLIFYGLRNRRRNMIKRSNLHLKKQKLMEMK